MTALPRIAAAALGLFVLAAAAEPPMQRPPVLGPGGVIVDHYGSRRPILPGSAEAERRSACRKAWKAEKARTGVSRSSAELLFMQKCMGNH